MTDDVKKIKHFNLGTVWGRVEGTLQKKLSNEGKGRKQDSKDGESKKGSPFFRLKVICPSYRGNSFAFGRLWNTTKAEALIDYLKKNPGTGIKLVGWFNQYDKTLENGTVERRSNFTWHNWIPDKCEDPRAAFSLVGEVSKIEGEVIWIHLEREGSNPENFKIHALEEISIQRITEGDTIQVKGYLRSKFGEDEFGNSDNSPILPYFDDKDLVIRDAIPFGR